MKVNKRPVYRIIKTAEETFKLVADMFKTHYETNGKHVVNIKCVSKEAYIAYKEKYPNEGTVVKFDENKISIEGN